jgi:hypothetical protein
MATIHLFKRSFDGRDTRIMVVGSTWHVLSSALLGVLTVPAESSLNGYLKRWKRANAILQDFALSALPLWAR